MILDTLNSNILDEIIHNNLTAQEIVEYISYTNLCYMISKVNLVSIKIYVDLTIDS